MFYSNLQLALEEERDHFTGWARSDEKPLRYTSLDQSDLTAPRDMVSADDIA
jgi:hypothetical protein